MPTLLVDILPDVSRAAVYRRVLPRGSLKDLIHRIADPLLHYSAKYGPCVGNSASAEEEPAPPDGRSARRKSTGGAALPMEKRKHDQIRNEGNTGEEREHERVEEISFAPRTWGLLDCEMA